MTSTYPIEEARAWLIDLAAAVCINIRNAIENGECPEELKTVFEKDWKELAKYPQQYRHALMDYIDIDEAAEILRDRIDKYADVVVCPEFEGEINFVHLDDGGIPTQDDNALVDDTLAYVSTRFAPDLFHAPYKDEQEIVEEFRKELSFILPDDYPVERNIITISGTYAC